MEVFESDCVCRPAAELSRNNERVCPLRSILLQSEDPLLRLPTCSTPPRKPSRRSRDLHVDVLTMICMSPRKHSRQGATYFPPGCCSPTQPPSTLQLLPCEDQTLLVWWNTFLVLGLAAFNSAIVQSAFGHVPSSTSKNKPCGANSSASASTLLILVRDVLLLGRLRDLAGCRLDSRFPVQDQLLPSRQSPEGQSTSRRKRQPQ